MYKALSEEIKTYENTRAHQREEMLRLNERMGSLIHSRDESSKIVEGDNRNDEARLRLDLMDKEIDELKREITEMNRRISGDVLLLRARILEAQEQALSELDKQLGEKHTEEAELKNILIPEAEKHLAALKERLRKNQDETQRLQKDVEEVNRMNLDALFRDPEAS